MAVEYATITGTVTRPNGTPLSVGAKFGVVYAATAGGIITSEDGLVDQVWASRIEVRSGETFSLPQLPQADVDSDGVGWVLETIPSMSADGRARLYPFELTADTTWNAIVAPGAAGLPVGVVGSRLTTLEAQSAGHTDHGNVSGAVTFNGPTGSHWFDATGPTTVTLAGFTEGQVVTLICFTGAEDVTVEDAGDVTLVDGTAWSAQLARSVWIGGGGGGEPVVPDSTPPSAVTDLAVSAVTDTTATLTWSAATDAESSVKYRYRVTVDGDTPGAYTQTTATTVNLTGLTGSTDYDVEVFAFSNGGNTTPDTATFTTAVTVDYDIGDDFTGSNGSISGRVTPVGAKTWVTPWWTTSDFLGPVGIVSNGATDGGGGSSSARVPVDEQDYVISADYNVTGGPQARLVARAASNPDTTNGSLVAIVISNGDVKVALGNSGAWHAELGGGAPTSGRIALEVIGTTGRVLINGVQKGGTFTAPATNPYAGVALYGGARLDNFEIEYL